MSTAETCPLCSAPVEESELTLTDGTISPRQKRCSNIACDAHRQPEKLEEQRRYLEYRLNISAGRLGEPEPEEPKRKRR